MTNSEQLIALARRLAACPAFHWLPGMRVADGSRIVESSRGLRCTEPDTLGGDHYGQFIGVTAPSDLDLPDLSDPLTRLAGVLLVRDAWGDDGACASRLARAPGWFVSVASTRASGRAVTIRCEQRWLVTFFGGTEAEALVDALLAAPEVQP